MKDKICPDFTFIRFSPGGLLYKHFYTCNKVAFATAIYFHLSLTFAGLPFAWNPISKVHYEKFYQIDSSGLDYKQVMIANDDSSIINK
jgi:hypothetical protein